MRRRHVELQWPQGLGTCEPEDWVEPADRSSDLWCWRAWSRWVDARMRHLESLGYRPTDAQYIAADAPLPARLSGPADPVIFTGDGTQQISHQR